MTPEQIKDAIGIDGLNVRRSDNGHYWFVSRTLTIFGQSHSRSIRLVDNPSAVEIEMARTAFEQWEAEEAISSYNLTSELVN
ncbi:MAG: hypothetical protein BVN33_14560 [Proteobacteria bacterium ST_bin13]|nr:MAG: hypothetical protein BVN33_14560 [Proteobacteria bacterium ST_bin13]